MVGRGLPNLRPLGEDHRGAGGGERMETLRSTDSGEVTLESVNWGRKRMRIRIHRALGCLHDAVRVLAVILWSLRARIWAIGTTWCDAGTIEIRVAKSTALQRMRKTMAKKTGHK